MRMNPYGGAGFMFGIFPILFFLIFLLILGIIIYSLSQRVKQNHRNNNSPVLTVEAVVTSKRTDVSGHRHNYAADNSMRHYTSSTWYYAAFQVESGDRIELEISGTEFGLLAEGDKGKLTFQGTRYLGFARS